MVACSFKENDHGVPGLYFLMMRIWKGHFSHHTSLRRGCYGLISQEWPYAPGGGCWRAHLTREEGRTVRAKDERTPQLCPGDAPSWGPRLSP